MQDMHILLKAISKEIKVQSALISAVEGVPGVADFKTKLQEYITQCEQHADTLGEAVASEVDEPEAEELMASARSTLEDKTFTTSIVALKAISRNISKKK